MKAETLKKLRERTGLTAYAFGLELAQRGITTPNHYYVLERGEAQGRVETVVGIARALAQHTPGATPLSVLGILLEVSDDS